jgi:phosphoribosylaminoimidazole-succinocarboxamide synthase
MLSCEGIKKFVENKTTKKEKEEEGMPKHSPKRAAWPVLEGLELLSRGKVRDSYRLPSGKRLVVATDGISALDFVLNAIIPQKGICLNVATVFWLKYLEQFGIKHHMIACGADIDSWLPVHLQNNLDLQSRAMVVEDLRILDTEFVYRACLTGSALAPYRETGMVCGHKLPPGLQDGDELPRMLFTPTTKAQEGHDLHVTAEEIMAKHPDQAKLGLLILRLAYDYAKAHGIVLADTKFEISADNTLSDEVLTPDSSRYWPYDVWLAGRKEEKRKAPPSFDKEPIRTWLKAKIAEWVTAHSAELASWIEKLANPKINGFDPEIPECVDVVHGFEMPESLIKQTTQGYCYIDWRLIGKTVDRFRSEDMGIQLPAPKPKRVAMVCGSESDKPIVMGLISKIDPKFAMVDLHIMSCDRNPNETADFGKRGILDYDVIVCNGSKALRLPSFVDAFAHAAGKDVPVIGVALGAPGSEELLAAQLCIKQIPSQPVIMDEITGKPYTGEAGLCDVLHRIIHGELPPRKPRKEAPVQMNVWSNHSK